MQILGLQRKLKNAVLNPYPIALQGFTQVITPPVVSHIIGVCSGYVFMVSSP
jgi:hypothetical protein